jgi:hypothetical protein
VSEATETKPRSPRAPWPLGLSTGSRITAAALGGLVVAIAASICLAVAVPDPRGLGLALGVLLLIPLWTTAMCLGFLARSPWKPWLVYLAAAAVLGAAAWLLRKGG